MGEEVRLKSEEYEQAIVRIFYENKAIGTGFLVAPGYVLTCAHVVAEAIHGDSNKGGDDSSQPTQKIMLDFPVLAPNQRFEAQVVAWLSYHAEYGDVAGLKVLGTIPQKIKPIPIHVINPEHLSSTERYCSCSFVSSGGVKSSHYSLDGRSTDRRLRFKIVPDSNEEKIRQGFSGAPIWNDQQGMVIGMLAQAKNTQAIAIPKEALDDASNPILQQLRAYSLADLWQDYLEGPEWRKIKGAIASALRYVNPEQDLHDGNIRKQLVSLCDGTYRGWEGVDRLTQFAVFLSLETISPTLLDQLEKWVGYWREDLAELIVRANREKIERHHSSENSNQHLIIEASRVEQVEPSEKEIVRFSIWEWKNQEISPTEWINEERLLEEFPTFLYENLAYHDHTLHIFVDRDWLHLDLSDRSMNEGWSTLGSDYKIVMRLHLKNARYQNNYYQKCQRKWQLLQGKLNYPATSTFIRADCLNYKNKDPQLIKTLRVAEMAILQNFDKAEICSFFEVMTKTTALPVVLWSRKVELCSLVESVLLDCQVHEIPEQIRITRENALGEDDDCIGRHLTLLWEDPNILPPSIQYNSEAC